MSDRVERSDPSSLVDVFQSDWLTWPVSTVLRHMRSVLSHLRACFTWNYVGGRESIDLTVCSSVLMARRMCSMAYWVACWTPKRWEVRIPARTESWFEISAPYEPLTNSAIISTLIVHVHYRWRDKTARESTGHTPSYAQPKKVKSLTFNKVDTQITHVCLLAALLFGSMQLGTSHDGPLHSRPKVYRDVRWRVHYWGKWRINK